MKLPITAFSSVVRSYWMTRRDGGQTQGGQISKDSKEETDEAIAKEYNAPRLVDSGRDMARPTSDRSGYNLPRLYEEYSNWYCAGSNCVKRWQTRGLRLAAPVVESGRASQAAQVAKF